MKGDQGEIIHFLRRPSNFASAYTFAGEIVLVYVVHGKKFYCSLIPYTIFEQHRLKDKVDERTAQGQLQSSSRYVGRGLFIIWF